MFEFTILEGIVICVVLSLIVLGMYRWVYYLGYKSEKRRKDRRNEESDTDEE